MSVDVSLATWASLWAENRLLLMAAGLYCSWILSSEEAGRLLVLPKWLCLGKILAGTLGMEVINLFKTSNDMIGRAEYKPNSTNHITGA